MNQNPIRTLIVDDVEGSRRVLARLLRDLGHLTDTAAGGAEALEKLGLGFDLVLLDVTMPGMDGFEVTRRIRQDPRHGDLPILIVTALDGREERLRAVEAGANDYLTKPVDYTELQIRTRVVLEMKAAQDAVRQSQARLEELVEQRTAALRQALEEVLVTQERLLEAEREKKRFYGNVLRAATGEKLHLMDAPELVAEGQLLAEVPLEAPEACSRLRRLVAESAQDAGMSAEKTADLLLGVGEAASNVLKHAGQGLVAIYASGQQMTVQVRDQGPGIHLEALPASLLVPGFSTQLSLGMGFTIILQVTDRLCLTTGPEGTVVQLEKAISTKADADQEELLLALLERF